MSICLIILSAAVLKSVIGALHRNFSRAEKEISLAEEKLLRLEAIQRQKEQLDDEYSKTILSHSGYSDSNSLFRQIENSAADLKLNIISLKPSQLSDEGLLQAYAIRMDFQDDPVTVIRFCHLLTERLNNVGIQQIQIKAANKQEAPRISLLLNAAVFNDHR